MDEMHEPDYAAHAETPVQGQDDRGRPRDLVIFMCKCGSEDCTWQIASVEQTRFTA